MHRFNSLLSMLVEEIRDGGQDGVCICQECLKNYESRIDSKPQTVVKSLTICIVFY